uniref:Uncharacterized protein n=1 Tax=Peronospora matthiolae TaxID=2874970 RepID=A0AAV1T6H1_9STRA
MDEKTDVEVYRNHVRKVLTLVREHKLLADLKKCIFSASEIPLLGYIVGKNGVRPDPGKIKAIDDWPVPVDVKGLRMFLGLVTYLHKYSCNYAEMTVNLSRLLKQHERWPKSAECQHYLEGIRKNLIQSPVLAIADQVDHSMWFVTPVIVRSAARYYSTTQTALSASLLSIASAASS